MEPYVGLGHFTEDFADRFFGRDTECSLIIGNLRAARLTLLYAESGVGKSSLLRAGVVARLHGFAEHDVELRGKPRLVPVVFSSWSEAPIAGLVRAVAEAVRPYLGADGEELELPEDDLERALELASTALDTTLLVVLDQFEEYFLYPETAPEEVRVAAQIARCVNRPDLRANFLISIREDSYARLGDLFRGKLTNVYANFLHLDFLDRDGARESIEKPIERVNELSANGDHYELEPALVEAVLDQVGRGRIEVADEDGRRGDGEGDEIETTYLQLVMRRLWEEETGAGSNRLRLRTLEQLGGSQAVITSHLDRAMEDETDGARLTAEQRLVAASIFHFLVTSGGTKIALTAQDLADLSGRPPAEIEPVLRHLSSPALHILRPVVAENGQGEPRFEIFHDALARPIVEWRTRVEETERDARLKRERVEKESAQRAAAEAEEREARERKRKRLALALAGVAVVLLVIGILYALFRAEELSDQRDAATQSVRAAERVAEFSGVPTFGQAAAALAGLEAYGLSPTEEARDQVLAQLQLNPGLPKIGAGHTRGVKTIAYLPGSDQVVSGGLDGTVRFWDHEGTQVGASLVATAKGGVDSVAVSSRLDGGGLLIAAGGNKFLTLWERTPSGKTRWLAKYLRPEWEEVWGLAFDPRAPTVLAVGTTGGTVALLDVADPDEPGGLGRRRAPGPVSDLSFSADGRSLLVASLSGGLEWKVSESGFVTSAPTVQDPKRLFSVATAPNGAFAFGGLHGIDVWDADGKRSYLGQAAEVSSLTFAAGGSVLVSAGVDWNVVTWDVASGRPFGPPRSGNLKSVLDVAVSPDDGTIAAATYDGLVKLWPLRPVRPLAITLGGLSPREVGPGVAEFRGLAVNDGRGLVAAAGGRAGTSIWRLRSPGATLSAPQPVARIPGYADVVAFAGELLAVARGRSFVIENTGKSCPTMSSRPPRPCRLAAPAQPHSESRVKTMAMKREHGRLLLVSSGFQDGESRINFWDLTDTERTGVIEYLTARKIHSGTEINQVAFSPTGSLVAAGAADGKLRVWDVSDPEDPHGSRIKHARGNEGRAVFAVAFSPDGRRLASAGTNQQVVLWNVVRHPSAPPTIELTGATLFQTQTIFSLAFSPSGETLAGGDGEGLICLYRVEGPDKIGGRSCLVGHSVEEVGYGGIMGLAFVRAPSGATSLVSAGTAQPIVAWSPILWNLSHSDRVEAEIEEDACAIAGQNLTASQWDSVFRATDLADERHKTCDQYPLPVEEE